MDQRWKDNRSSGLLRTSMDMGVKGWWLCWKTNTSDCLWGIPGKTMTRVCAKLGRLRLRRCLFQFTLRPPCSTQGAHDCLCVCFPQERMTSLARWSTSTPSQESPMLTWEPWATATWAPSREKTCWRWSTCTRSSPTISLTTWSSPSTSEMSLLR